MCYVCVWGGVYCSCILNAAVSVYCFVRHLLSKLIYWYEWKLIPHFRSASTRTGAVVVCPNRTKIFFWHLAVLNCPVSFTTRSHQLICAPQSKCEQEALLHANMLLLLPIASLCNKTQERRQNGDVWVAEGFVTNDLYPLQDQKLQLIFYFWGKFLGGGNWNHHAKMLTVIFTGCLAATEKLKSSKSRKKNKKNTKNDFQMCNEHKGLQVRR